MPNYKQWIYSVNLAIVAIEMLLIYLAYNTFFHPWWSLIPIYRTDVILLLYSTLITLQIIACCCGLFGAWFSNLQLLKIYWILMIPLLLMDLIMAPVFGHRFSSLHRNFPDQIESTARKLIRRGSFETCAPWNSFQRRFGCCAPNIIQAFCNHNKRNDTVLLWEMDDSCYEDQGRRCNLEILRWMYSRCEWFGVLIYYALVPMKAIVVLVLREDIRHLFFRRQFLHFIDWEDSEDEELQLAMRKKKSMMHLIAMDALDHQHRHLSVAGKV